ncbi:hypothetical protein Tco_1213484 [Tanacetum coccineum]
MLAPSGGGLILYQAYGRKAHLLEDKQIPSIGVFDEVHCLGSCKTSYRSPLRPSHHKQSSLWTDDLDSDDEVDEVLFPEGNKFEEQLDIRLKGLIQRESDSWSECYIQLMRLSKLDKMLICGVKRKRPGLHMKKRGGGKTEREEFSLALFNEI